MFLLIFVVSVVVGTALALALLITRLLSAVRSLRSLRLRLSAVVVRLSLLLIRLAIMLLIIISARRLSS